MNIIQKVFNIFKKGEVYEIKDPNIYIEKFKEDYINTKNKVAICAVINKHIEILDRLNKTNLKINQNLAEINKINKRIRKIKKNVNTDITEITMGKKAVELDHKQIQQSIDLYLDKGISLEKLNSLLNFINQADFHELFSEKHANVYYSLPKLSYFEKNLMQIYTENYNDVVTSRNNQIKINQEIKNKEREEARLNTIENNVEPVIETLITEELNNDFDEEFEDIIEHVPLEKSIIIFNNFLAGNKLEDIKLLFPNINDSTYFTVKNDTFTLLNNELNSLYELLENKHDEEILNQTKNYESYIDELSEHFDLIENNKIEDVKNIPKDKGTIFYSITTSGKFYIQEDLEQFDDIGKINLLKLINRLKEARFTNNIRQERKFANNKKLKDIFELKRPNVRLIYKDLGNNNYYVLMALRKSDKTDRDIVKSIIARNRLCAAHFEMIKNSFNDDNFINALVQSSKLVDTELTEEVNKIR